MGASGSCGFLGRKRTIWGRGGERGDGDVDGVEEKETDGLPQLDLLVEEDDDQVDHRDEVEEDVAEEGSLVDLAVGENGHASCDDGRDEHAGSHVRTNADLGHAAEDGHDQRKHVRGTVTEGEERHSGDARRNVELLHDGIHDDAEVTVCRRRKKGKEKNQNEHPEKRKPLLCRGRTTVLEVPRSEAPEIEQTGSLCNSPDQYTRLPCNCTSPTVKN